MELSCALVWLFLCATWAEEENVVTEKDSIKRGGFGGFGGFIQVGYQFSDC